MGSKYYESPFKLTMKDLQYLLAKELKSNLEVVNFRTEGLTKPGDNYGSTIFAVEVTCKENSDEPIHNLSLVVKLMPLSEFLCDVFNIGITFNKEVRTYVLVCPELKRLQEETGIKRDKMLNIFPKFYGARTNIQENLFEEADHSAVLLLENLKTAGYIVGDPKKGLDLKHLRFVVTQLARFHALTLALKFRKPKVFKETILKACEKYRLGSKFIKMLISTTLRDVEAVLDCTPYIKRMENKIEAGLEVEFVSRPVPKEPFATMLHNDLWLSNMLFKYDSNTNNEIPIGMKFVDYQLVVYDSPVRDLLFFLFTSSADGLLEEHLENLIHLYHEELVKQLKKLHCKIRTFSLSNLHEELNGYALREFPYILFMLRVISGENDDSESSPESDIDLFNSNIGEAYLRRLRSLILIYVNKGWL